MNILELLENEKNLRNLSTSLLADYLLNFNGDLEHVKVRSLCDEARVSYATPTRLAQKCGFKGFREFKYELNLFYIKRSKMPFNDEGIDYDKYKQYLIESMDVSFSQMHSKDIEEIAKLIADHRIIKIFGEGQSHILGLDLQSKLQRFNKVVLCPCSESDMYVTSRGCEKDELLIGISYSGRTMHVVNALVNGKQKDAKVILFTDNTNLSKEFDHVYQLNLSENQVSNTSMISNSLLLILFDFIYLEIIKIDKQAKNNFADTKLKH